MIARADTALIVVFTIEALVTVPLVLWGLWTLWMEPTRPTPRVPRRARRRR